MTTPPTLEERLREMCDATVFLDKDGYAVQVSDDGALLNALRAAAALAFEEAADVATRYPLETDAGWDDAGQLAEQIAESIRALSQSATGVKR
jgi:hypothetical protein